MRTVWILVATLVLAAASALVFAFLPDLAPAVRGWGVPLSLSISIVLTAAVLLRIAWLSSRCCPKEPAADQEKAREPWYRLRGLLDSGGGEAENLKASLDLIRRAAKGTGDRQPAVAQAIRDAEEYLRRNSEDISARLREAQDILDRHGTLYRSSGRDLTIMANAWERARGVWPVAADTGDSPDVASVLRRVQQADDYLDEMTFAAARVIVPAQVKEWAAALHPGDSLDFHETFKRELPSARHRLEILKWLSRATGTVPGIVDVDRGIIRVASPSPARRRGTWVLILNFALWGAAIAAAVPVIAWSIGADLGRLQPRDTLVLYSLVLLGGLAHFGIDALKDERASASGPRAIENVALWVHVHERQVLWAIVALWLTWLLWLLFDRNPSWWVAFLIGYSADSFFDLFIGKFTDSVNAKLKVVEARFSTATGT